MTAWLLKPRPHSPITYGDTPENQWRIAGDSLVVMSAISEEDARKQADALNEGLPDFMVQKHPWLSIEYSTCERASE